MIEENVSKNPGALHVALAGPGSHALSAACQPREVPDTRLARALGGSGASLRRLDVLRLCLRCIFDNRVSDARKVGSVFMNSKLGEAHATPPRRCSPPCSCR